MPPNLQLLRRRLLLLSGFGVLKKDKGPELGRFSNKSCVIPGIPSTSCYLLVISWWVCHCAVEICWNHSAPVSMNSARRRWMPATRWALSWRTMRHMRHMGVGMCGQAATKSVQSWSNLHQSCSKLIQHHKSALRYCIFLIYIYILLKHVKVIEGLAGLSRLHLTASLFKTSQLGFLCVSYAADDGKPRRLSREFPMVLPEAELVWISYEMWLQVERVDRVDQFWITGESIRPMGWKEPRDTWVSWAWNWDFCLELPWGLVVDEGHRIKNHKAHSSQAEHDPIWSSCKTPKTSKQNACPADSLLFALFCFASTLRRVAQAFARQCATKCAAFENCRFAALQVVRRLPCRHRLLLTGTPSWQILMVVAVAAPTHENQKPSKTLL